jgi:hypothetical protein
MGKIISRGLLPPDDPMFSGGLETFSVRKQNKPVVTATGLSLGGMLDTLASFADDDEDRPAEPEDKGGAS